MELVWEGEALEYALEPLSLSSLSIWQVAQGKQQQLTQQSHPSEPSMLNCFLNPILRPCVMNMCVGMKGQKQTPNCHQGFKQKKRVQGTQKSPVNGALTGLI